MSESDKSDCLHQILNNLEESKATIKEVEGEVTYLPSSVSKRIASRCRSITNYLEKYITEIKLELSQ